MNAGMEKSLVEDAVQFTFEQHPLTLFMERGEPLWVLSELCEILGLPNVSQVAARLPDEEKSYITLTDVIGRGTRKRVVVTESGFYRVLFRSDKEEARKFQSWVFTEVLPQIRKTGKYSVEASLEDPSRQVDIFHGTRFAEFQEMMSTLYSMLEANQKFLSEKKDTATANLLHNAQVASKLVAMGDQVQAIEAMVTKLPGRISNIVAAVVEDKIMHAVQPDNSEALEKIRVLKDQLLQLETDLTN